MKRDKTHRTVFNIQIRVRADVEAFPLLVKWVAATRDERVSPITSMVHQDMCEQDALVHSEST